MSLPTVVISSCSDLMSRFTFLALRKVDNSQTTRKFTLNQILKNQRQGQTPQYSGHTDGHS